MTPPPPTQWPGPSADWHSVVSDPCPWLFTVNVCVQKPVLTESLQCTVTDDPGANPSRDTLYHQPVGYATLPWASVIVGLVAVGGGAVADVVEEVGGAGAVVVVAVAASTNVKLAGRLKSGRGDCQGSALMVRLAATTTTDSGKRPPRSSYPWRREDLVTTESRGSLPITKTFPTRPAAHRPTIP